MEISIWNATPDGVQAKLAYTLHSTRQHLAVRVPEFPSAVAELNLCPGLEGPLAVVPDYAVLLNTLWIGYLILQIDILPLVPARQLDIVHLRDARSPGNDFSCAGLPASSQNCTSGTSAHARRAYQSCL